MEYTYLFSINGKLAKAYISPLNMECYLTECLGEGYTIRKVEARTCEGHTSIKLYLSNNPNPEEEI